MVLEVSGVILRVASTVLCPTYAMWQRTGVIVGMVFSNRLKWHMERVVSGLLLVLTSKSHTEVCCFNLLLLLFYLFGVCVE